MERHHLLFARSVWSAQKSPRALRETTGLIIPIDKDSHKELHRAIPFVPVLGYITASKVLQTLEIERGNHLKNIDSLMFSIEGAIERSSVIEKHVGWLALDAIDMQRQFIIDGVQQQAA